MFIYMFIPSKSGAGGFLVILGWSDDDQNVYWPCVYCIRIYFSLRIHRWWLKFLREYHSFQGSKTWSRSISSRFEIWQKRPHPGYFNGFKRVVKNDEHFRPIFVIKSSLTVFRPLQRHHKDSMSESWQLKPLPLVAFLSMLWRTAKHRAALPGYIFGLDFATVPNVSMEKITLDHMFSFLNGLLFVVLASQFIPQWFILAHLWRFQMPLVSHQLIRKWCVPTRKSSKLWYLPVGLTMIDPWLEFFWRMVPKDLSNSHSDLSHVSILWNTGCSESRGASQGTDFTDVIPEKVQVWAWRMS